MQRLSCWFHLAAAAPPAPLRLGHGSSGSAVSQAGAAALVRELQRGGDRKARRRGPGQTQRGGRLVWAPVLEQDVHAFLAPCAVGQGQRRLALGVPTSNIAAILRRQKRVLAGLLHDKKSGALPTAFV